MDQLKISYCVYLKNPKRPNAHYYCRVRQNGKTTDIDLKTQNKAVATAWVALRRSEVERYNQYVLCGERVPSDLERSIVRVGAAPASAQKTAGILTEAVDEWEREMRRVGKRETTIASYTRAMSVICPETALVADINEDSTRLWLSKFDGHSASYRKFCSVALREFCRFCVKRYGIDRDLIDKWDFVKVQHVDRPHWSMQQMAHIIDSVECKDKVKERFYKAYYWVMATCGSRQGETYELLWSDLKFSDPVSGTLTFRAETTKNNQTRVVPLDWRIARLLSRLPHEGARIFGCLPKSQAARYRVLQRAIEASGEPAGNQHTFRHSVSLILYKSSKDIKATAQLLGHSPQVSLFYYQAAREEDQLREVVDTAYEGQNLLPSPINELAELDLL